jgi:hypothetical protein
MLRLAIGRTLLWLIAPAEAERDQPIRERSIARRIAYEQKLERETPAMEAMAAEFKEAAERLDNQLAERRLSSCSAAANLV